MPEPGEYSRSPVVLALCVVGDVRGLYCTVISTLLLPDAVLISAPRTNRLVGRYTSRYSPVCYSRTSPVASEKLAVAESVPISIDR